MVFLDALLDPRRAVNSLYRFLDENGDGSGNKSANQNYALTPTRFFIQPPLGEIYFIERMIVYLEDSGTLDAGGWGNGSALTNGLIITTQIDGVLDVDLCDGIPLKINAQWAQVCYDVGTSDFGSGVNVLGGRWTFQKSGRPLVLRGDNLESFGIAFSDDVSGIVNNTFMVQGYTRSWRG